MRGTHICGHKGVLQMLLGKMTNEEPEIEGKIPNNIYTERPSFHKKILNGSVSEFKLFTVILHSKVHIG